MIVEEKKYGECLCRFDDSAYKDKTEEEIKKTVAMFSAFMIECLQKKEKFGDKAKS